MSGTIGGERFRMAWRELQDALWFEEEAQMIEWVRLWREGERVRVEMKIKDGALKFEERV